MTSSTEYKYIQTTETGTAIIAGTTMKVVELITSVRAYGWSPEELHTNYLQLLMSQIYSALSYYWDYKAEIDAEVAQQGLL